MAKDKTPNKDTTQPGEYGKDPRITEILAKQRIDREDAQYLIDNLNEEDRERVKVLAQYFAELIAFNKELEDLKPYLEKELQKPQYNGKTLEELREEADQAAENQYYNSKAEPAAPLPPEVQAAHAKEAEALAIWEQLITAARTARGTTITVRRPDLLAYPVDKINSNIWGLLEKDTQGQIGFDMSKQGSNNELITYYSINFEALDNVKISRRLTHFDKAVIIAAAAIYNAGQEVLTLTQIHYLMGNTKRPSQNQLEKLANSIEKMGAATISIDNREVVKQYNYPEYVYTGKLLPHETVKAVVNGKTTEAAIHLFREPPVITFAKLHKQVTTIKASLLQVPISNTDTNIAIKDYLIERIAVAKRQGKKSETILLRTLVEKTQAQKTKKKDLIEKVQACCKHFKAEQFITGAKITADKITIEL